MWAVGDVFWFAGRFEATQVERGLVCRLPPAILAVMDTIRLRAGEAAGTGAVLIYGLVVPSRWRVARPAASNRAPLLYHANQHTSRGKARNERNPRNKMKTEYAPEGAPERIVALPAPHSGHGRFFRAGPGFFSRSSFHPRLISTVSCMSKDWPEKWSVSDHGKVCRTPGCGALIARLRPSRPCG